MTKVHISTTNDDELRRVLRLLKPFADENKVKIVDNKPPYKHVYIMPKKPIRHRR
jgi:hypothetical protein